MYCDGFLLAKDAKALAFGYQVKAASSYSLRSKTNVDATPNSARYAGSESGGGNTIASALPDELLVDLWHL